MRNKDEFNEFSYPAPLGLCSDMQCRLGTFSLLILVMFLYEDIAQFRKSGVKRDKVGMESDAFSCRLDTRKGSICFLTCSC